MQDCPAAPLTAACLALLAGTAACDVKLTGADKTVPNLKGGLDGVYTVTACESGRPVYTRQNSTNHGAHVLHLCCLAAYVASVCMHQPARGLLSSWPASRLPLPVPVPVPMQCLSHLSLKAAFETARSVPVHAHA